jgi:hypothetical protein
MAQYIRLLNPPPHHHLSPSRSAKMAQYMIRLLVPPYQQEHDPDNRAKLAKASGAPAVSQYSVPIRSAPAVYLHRISTQYTERPREPR